MKHLIIDLDSLLYKAGFSVETVYRHLTHKDLKGTHTFSSAKEMKAFIALYELEDYAVENERVVEPVDNALALLSTLVANIKSKFSNYYPTMYVGGTDNFRMELYPLYKANREKLEKPVYLPAMREYIEAQGAIVPNGYEADDAVCIHAWEAIKNREEYIIAGIDKDLRQIPGTHYDYNKDLIIEVDPWGADFNFYTQLLMGDNSDNIPGIKGIGIKRAHAMLEECNDERDMYKICEDIWDNKEAMTISAKLLYLLRHEDDEWRPPSE